MLVAFTLENYKSFRDKQRFSFVSSQGDEHPEHVIELNNGLKINKIAAIIGGNSVGKSQLLAAIVDFSMAITRDKLHELHHPHIIDQNYKEQATSYEVIITDQKKELFLRYGISVLKEKIISEYLYSRPIKKSAKESCIFERTLNNVNFVKPEYKKLENLIQPVLKESGAIITFSRSLEINELNEIFIWSIHQIPYNPENHKNDAISFVEEHLNKEIEKGNSDNVDKFLSDYNNYIKLCPIYVDSVILQPQGDDGKLRFVYKLKDNEGNENILIGVDSRLSFFSKGTLNVLGFIAVLLWSYKNKFNLYIDEIDSSIHYSLANALLKKIIKEICLIDNVQFIFSTHNLPLLDECIRRDELNIIYKNKDRSSEIINASKFSVRKDAKLSAKYFRGEFGMLPAFAKEIMD